MKTTLKEWFATIAIILSVFSVILTAKDFQSANSLEITSERIGSDAKLIEGQIPPHFVEPLIFTPARFEADANRANPRCVQRPKFYNALNTY